MKASSRASRRQFLERSAIVSLGPAFCLAISLFSQLAAAASAPGLLGHWRFEQGQGDMLKIPVVPKTAATIENQLTKLEIDARGRGVALIDLLPQFRVAVSLVKHYAPGHSSAVRLGGSP